MRNALFRSNALLIITVILLSHEYGHAGPHTYKRTHTTQSVLYRHWVACTETRQ